MTAAADTTDFMFERHQLVTDASPRQTVVAGFVLGGAVADLAVINFDRNDERRLRLYRFDDGGWAKALEADLRPGVLFVDVVRLADRDRLVTYERGRLNWFDPETATEHELLAVASEVGVHPGGLIPHLDISRDLNGDGRDDLTVPDADGFWLFVQLPNGQFAEPLKLGPPIDMSGVYAKYGYRSDPWARGRVHQIDYDGDGRGDLVFWNGDRFAVHRQDERGFFEPAAERFTTAITFDSDDMTSLAAPHGVRHRHMDRDPTGALTGRVLRALTDMNGDGVADLVVFSLAGGSLWRMHSFYEVHFGRPAPGGIVEFAPQAGATIRADGIPFGLEPHDLDGDGQLDMMFTVINPGIFKAVGMLLDSLLNDSVSMQLQFFRMHEGAYPAKPDTTRKVKAHSFGQSGERASVFPAVLLGDVTGDQRADLLIQHRRRELRIYPGVPDPSLFARRPQRIKIAMPNEEYAWLADLNGDGKLDVVLHHPSTTEPDRVTLLIAR